MFDWCESCLWSDQCASYDPCAHFTPPEEELVDDVIESNRYKFRKEWFMFMEELED